MPEWESGFLESNGIRMHYARTGGDRPPLGLAHGFSDDGLCWTPVARALEAEFDVVMPDARFHGLSGAPEQDGHDGVMADDLAGAIRALGLRAHRPGAFHGRRDRSSPGGALSRPAARHCVGGSAAELGCRAQGAR